MHAMGFQGVVRGRRIVGWRASNALEQALYARAVDH
jgi:hypothetical protein